MDVPAVVVEQQPVPLALFESQLFYIGKGFSVNRPVVEVLLVSRNLLDQHFERVIRLRGGLIVGELRIVPRTSARIRRAPATAVVRTCPHTRQPHPCPCCARRRPPLQTPIRLDSSSPPAHPRAPRYRDTGRPRFGDAGTGFPSMAITRNWCPGSASRISSVALAFNSRNSTRCPSRTRIGSPAPSILPLNVAEPYMISQPLSGGPSFRAPVPNDGRRCRSPDRTRLHGGQAR